MARIANLNLSQSEVSQDIDLKESLGIDLSTNSPMKQAVGQWIIDRILNRTAKGVDAYGKPFKKYSKEYEASLEFKAWKHDNTVNLELHGDMLAAIDILADKGNTIKVGIKNEEQAAKAYGHMTGMKGHPFLDGITPVRTFFGLSDDDIAAMKKEFSPDLINSSSSEKLIDSILEKLIGRFSQSINAKGDASNGSDNQGN